MKSNKPFNPESGDGIISLVDGRWAIVKGRQTRGKVEGSDLDPHELIGIKVRYYKEKKDQFLKVGDYRQETFSEFLNRPTGFGKNSDLQFWSIFIGVSVSFAIGWITRDSDGVYAILFGLAVLGLLFLGSYLNYTKRLR